MRGFETGSSSGKTTLESAITEISSSSSSEELSPESDHVFESDTPTENKEVKTNSKPWLPEPANQLLDKLTKMKMFRKLRLGSHAESDVIAGSDRVEAKQERNGRYGVEG